MAKLKLSLACWNYDRTRALMDGSVSPDGIELEYHNLFPAVTFERMLRDREFDASELGLTFYLASLALDDSPFVAIPVYPVRLFVHSAIYVNANSGIQSPADLAGKRVGELFAYGHDAGTWTKGILNDEYGVAPEACSYLIGGVDRPTPPWDWFNLRPPANVSVQHVGADRSLDDMLETGEIAALHSALVPPSFLKGSKNVRRLFTDFEAVERDYFRKTEIFPIMHIVAIRKDVYQRNPWVATSLYKAFNAAKDQASSLYKYQAAHMHRLFMIPWLTQHLEETHALMGDDVWPYGLKHNYKALDTFLRYHHQHGLSQRRYTPEELFVPEMLNE